MKCLQKLFVLAVIAFLTLGLARSIWAPKAINSYENRYAEQMPAVSAAGYLDTTFQDGVEAGLMDQVPLAQTMKSLYNRTHARWVLSMVDALYGEEKTQYVAYEGLRLFGENYLVNWTRTLEASQEDLDRKIQALNATFARHPELDFYVYYIEKDTDIDFITGEKSGLAEYLLSGLDLPAERQAVFTVDSFAEFAQKFYKTDTHWNYAGSYEGYCQLHDLLGCQGPALRPAGEAQLVGDAFSGVKAGNIGAEGILTEPFYAVPYDFPAMSISINGASGGDYGDQAAFLQGTSSLSLTYGNFYGGDNGETVFSTGTQGRGSLLVLGESFDNAILKLLASHYDTLYSVDLRYYEHSMGHPFDLSAYTKEHGISSVLLLGNIDYFVQDTFDPEA